MVDMLVTVVVPFQAKIDLTNLYFAELSKGIDDIALLYKYNIIMTSIENRLMKEDQQKKVNKYAVSGQKARKRLFVQRRQVVKTNEHQQSSTTSKSDNSRVSSDHQSNPSSSNTSGRTGNESKQVHNYLTVSNKVKTNYYMQVRKKSHTNYKIYKTGGYNTSQINLKPIDYSKKYRGKKVHVLASENTSDGRTWLEIYLGKKFVGWINAN